MWNRYWSKLSRPKLWPRPVRPSDLFIDHASGFKWEFQIDIEHIFIDPVWISQQGLQKGWISLESLLTSPIADNAIGWVTTCQLCLWVFRYLKIIESDIDIEKGCAQKRTDQSVLLNGSFRFYILGYFSTKRCLPSGEQEWKTKEKSFVYQATKSWWPRQIIKHFPLKTYCCCFCFAAIVTGLQLSYGLVSLKANKVLLWF